MFTVCLRENYRADANRHGFAGTVRDQPDASRVRDPYGSVSELTGFLSSMYTVLEQL